MKTFLFTFITAISLSALHAADTKAELKDLSINGGLQDGKARLVIEAQMKGSSDEHDRILFATELQHSIHLARDVIDHTFVASIEILQGDPRELPFTITGD